MSKGGPIAVLKEVRIRDTEVEDERNHQRQSCSCIYMVMLVRDRLPLTADLITS